MRRSLITAAAIAALAPCFVASTAHADTEGCVSHAEFDNTYYGETVSHVATRFDIYGFYIDDTNSTFRRGYRTCWAPGVRQGVVVYSYDTGGAVNWYVRDAP